MKYAVVFEKTDNNFAAYGPDLPGCVATGASQREVELSIREALAFHLEGLRAEGEELPLPASWTEFVEA